MAPLDLPHDHVLFTASDWRPAPHGYAYRMGKQQDGAQQFMHVLELLQLDPRLPKLFAKYLSLNRPNQWVDIAAELVATIAVWNGCQFMEYRQSCIYEVCNIVVDDDDTDNVMLAIETFNVRTITANLDEPLPYATFNGRQAVETTTTWLDTHFAGWKERLLAAEALDYSGTELAHLVCPVVFELPAHGVGPGHSNAPAVLPTSFGD